MTTMPYTDWQFWIVTVIALAGALILGRSLLGRIFRKGSAKVKPQKTGLTIEGAPVARETKPPSCKCSK